MRNVKFIGGALCLDFVNTVDAWVEGRVRSDKIETGQDLLAWSKLAGIGKVEMETSQTAGSMVPRARVLRDSIYRIMRSVLKHRTPPAADLAVFNCELAIAYSHRQLQYSRGRLLWTWSGSAGGLDRVLWSVVDSAANLLTSADVSRLRECGGTDCGWLFLDTTRNHSRHWCDMGDCGNLAKVRRFRARQDSKVC